MAARSYLVGAWDAVEVKGDQWQNDHTPAGELWLVVGAGRCHSRALLLQESPLPS